MVKLFYVFLFFGANVVLSQGVGSGTDGNLRVCVVESRGTYKRATRFCPKLEEEKSGVECVLGTDRLDCLRRMSKGTVDFGVFYPEDLVAATWAGLDVLVTNELRNRDRPFEQSIVAVVSRRVLSDGGRMVSGSSGSARAMLRNATLCHAGLRVDDRGLSDNLAQYLEYLVTDRSCDATLSLAENRVLALANYFGRGCRAGDWTPDRKLDADLKSRYPSLCAACQSGRCTKSDGFYGDSGALGCLSAGGDVTWQQLQTVEAYFGLLPGTEAFAPPDDYAYLCRDGSWQPLANNTAPCVWLQRPWPVIVAKTKSSEAVSGLAISLHNDSIVTNGHWRGALASLLEVNQAQPEPLRPQRNPADHLAKAVGFREAYNQAGCTPSRHITICTSSNIEQNKCTWLAEAGAVYGVRPTVQCAKRSSREECIADLGEKVDATVADSNWLIAAQRDYSVTPLLQEITPIVEQTSNVVAYVKRNAKISNMADLRGKRAVFPLFDGYAWHAVAQYLSTNKNMCSGAIMGYFSEICAPVEEKLNVTQEIREKLMKSCIIDEDDDDEMKALRALVEDRADVAFVSMGTFKKYAGKVIPKPWAQSNLEIIPICPRESKKYCFLSWSSLGHVYTSKRITALRRQEIINVFEKLDQLFGKNTMFHTPMFAMYGPYHDTQNVMFHNNTRTLTTVSVLNTHPYNKIPMSFERDLVNFSFSSCGFDYLNGARCGRPVWLTVLFLVSFVLLR